MRLTRPLVMRSANTPSRAFGAASPIEGEAGANAANAGVQLCSPSMGELSPRSGD